MPITSSAVPATLPQNHSLGQPLESSDATRRLEDKRTSRTKPGFSPCLSYQRAFNENGDVIHIACDQWKCPACAPILAYRWAERVRYGMALWGKPAYFWTLTLPGWVDNPSRGYALLPQRWDKLRKAIQRGAGNFHYAAFVEAHPHRLEIPHYHIISLVKAPTRLKDMAVKCGFGQQAIEVEINGKMAASYVTKYASKQGRSMPKGFRRVRISQIWPRLPEPVYEFEVYPIAKGESLRDYLERMSRATHLPPSQLTQRWLDPSRDIVDSPTPVTTYPTL